MSQASGSDVHFASSDKLLFSAVSAVVVALLLWVGTTLNSNQLQITKLQVEVQQLNQTIVNASKEDREVKNRLRELELKVSTLNQRGNR